jgi:hypothetical protein
MMKHNLKIHDDNNLNTKVINIKTFFIKGFFRYHPKVNKKELISLVPVMGLVYLSFDYTASAFSHPLDY